LYDTLEEDLGEEFAQFVVAYRLYGSADPLSMVDLDLDTPYQTSEKVPVNDVAKGIAAALFGGRGGSVTRGGMDLSGGAQFEIESLYDLIGAAVEGEIDKRQQFLVSPWSADPGEMQAYAVDFFDALSVTEEPYAGRINVNQARLEVLSGIPGMEEGLPETIIGSQLIGPDGEPLLDSLQLRTTTAWLVIQGIVPLEQMRGLDKYLTARGDVYRAQVVGYFDTGGPTTRQEVIFDAAQSPPKILSVRDLSELGRGYTPIQLNGNLSNGVE